MQTTNAHVTTLVFAEVRQGGQVAIMIPTREGRGEPTVEATTENSITWKCADGATERLGTAAAPLPKDVIDALGSPDGLLVMLCDTRSDALVGDFVVKSAATATA